MAYYSFMYYPVTFAARYVTYIYKVISKPHFAEAVRMAQWLEQRHKDLVIFASLVQIPLWDVGAGPSDETV